MAQATPQLPKAENGEEAVGGVYQLVDLGSAKLTAGDIDGAYSALTRAVAMPEFGASRAEVRFAAYVTLAYAEAILGKDADALRHLDLAAPLGDRNATYWQIYLQVSAATDDLGKAVHAAATIATEFPELAASWDDAFVFALLRQSRDLDEAKDDRIVLLDALWRTGYRPVDTNRSIDPYWMELLDARLDENNIEQARLIAGTIEKPDAIKQLSIDAKYFGLAPKDPARSWLKAADREIDQLKDLVDQQPNQLRPLATLATWLNRVGRTDEALAILDKALRRIEAAPTGVTAFEDQSQYLEWVHNGRSVALSWEGRLEEAAAAQELAWKTAVAIDPGSASQAINLAAQYLVMGDTNRAMEVVATINPDLASDFGRMGIRWVEACAAHLGGDDTAARTVIAAMRETWSAGYGSLASAVFCVESDDEAANFILDSLDSDEVRNSALDVLQRGMQAKSSPDLQVEMDRRLEAIRQRADIKAAVAKHGVILDWPYVF